jgi:hypothetical protein
MSLTLTIRTTFLSEGLSLKLHDGLTFASLAVGFIGVLLTFFDVGGAIRRGRQYFAAPRPLAAAIKAEVSVRAEGTVAGRKPTTEERVAALEGNVVALREELWQQMAEVQKVIVREVGAATRAAQANLDTKINPLRDLVLSDRPKGIWDLTGPVLVLLGLVLGACAEWASICGN